MFDIQTNSRVFHRLTSSRAINVNNTFQIIFCGWKDSWIPIYLHWWNYWAHWLKHFLVVFWRRSLGFIAASRVSYGPLTEYKATRAKNYNKNKQKKIFQYVANLRTFGAIWSFPVGAPLVHFAPIWNSATVVGCCQLQAQTHKYQQILVFNLILIKPKIYT